MSEPFEKSWTAAPEDIDELGHVNNTVWVTWIQDMATSHWKAVAEAEHIAAYIWVITRHEIDYRGNVKAGERVTGRTWVDGTPRGARFDRRVDFLNDAGKVMVSAKTTWAIIDRTSGRIVRVPREVAANFV